MVTKQCLEGFGYSEVRELPAGVLAGLRDQIFTTGLFVGLDETGYSHRYCYESYELASAALRAWDGLGDPPGPWIKRKGLGEEKLGPGVL